MNSHDITKAQAKVIHDSLYPGLNYLARLNARMQKLRWTPDDKLFQLVGEAYSDAPPVQRGPLPRLQRCRPSR